MIFDRGIRKMRNEVQLLTAGDASGWRVGGEAGKSGAMKLSAVNRCVEVLSDSLAKLPCYVMLEGTKERLDAHPLLRLLEGRPNESMTPAVYKKLMEASRLLCGNAYALIGRSGYSARPIELLPLPNELVQPFFDDNGRLWYLCTNPRTGERRRVRQWELLHYKAFSYDGILGVSVLSRAADIVATGRAAQQYEESFYGKGARPSGVLTVAGSLEKPAKDKIRREWEEIHSGADHAFRVAVLDLGLQYTPIGVSQRDAQFVESKAVAVEDIARFFGVPLHKLMAGKQAYSSNEQNSIEYVNGTVSPIVIQCNQEDTYKLLFDSELGRGMRLKRNLLAELQGDVRSRADWYRTMREIGVFSVNNILGLEDMPPVSGGDTHYASLNFVPLDRFDELSLARNAGGQREEKA